MVCYTGCKLHTFYKNHGLYTGSKLRLLYQPWFVYGVQIASLVQFFDVFYHLYKGGFPLYKGIWWRWRKKRGGLGEREDMAGKELQVRVCCAHAPRRHTDDCS